MTPAIAPADVQQFRTFITERTGLQVDEPRLAHLAELLHVRMRANSCADFQAYARRLGSPLEVIAEERAIAESLTVGETYFFRHPDHFLAFREHVLPSLQATDDHPRILSAGCASGEEALSLAIILREQGWRSACIAGLDINGASLGKARAGHYSRWSLRGTTAEVKDRYFRARDGGFRICETIHAMVQFEERNLVGGDPAFWTPARFDVIFCRNVLIYFSPEATQALIARFARVLAPGGYLFLGPSETLRGVSDGFRLCQTHGTFYYQREGEPASARRVDASAIWPEESPIIALDQSWVQAIGQATQRVSRLSGELGAPEIPTAPAAPANVLPEWPGGWDLSEALALFREERFGEARACLTGPTGEPCGPPEARLLLAAILTNSGSLGAAECLLTDLLASDDQSVGAHYLAALCCEHAGDLATAVYHDETAAHLDPLFAMPHLHLGLLARRRGDHEGADLALQHALDLLENEDAARVLLFGGGFGRQGLQSLCRSELRRGDGEGRDHGHVDRAAT